MKDKEVFQDDGPGLYGSKLDLTDHQAPMAAVYTIETAKESKTLGGHVTGIKGAAEEFTVDGPDGMDSRTQSWKKKVQQTWLHVRSNKSVQHVLLCILVALVVCGLVIGISVHLAKQTSTPETKPSSRPTTEIHVKVTNTFHGRVKVVAGEFSVYSSALADQASSAYLGYEETFTTLVNRIYAASEMGEVFSHCALLQLRGGSVDVDFSLVFTEPIGLSVKSSAYTTYTAWDVDSTFHRAFIQSDKNEHLYKMGDRFIVDANSIKIEPVDAYPYSSKTSTPPTTRRTIFSTSTTTELPTTTRAKPDSTTKLTTRKSTTTSPHVSTPHVTTHVTRPPVTTHVTRPRVTPPHVTTHVTRPHITPPHVTTHVTRPRVTRPRVTTPHVTLVLPHVTRPLVTRPRVTTPPVTRPHVSTPPVTRPRVTTPHVTAPVTTPPAGSTTNESQVLCHENEFQCDAGVQTLQHLRNYCIKAQERCDGFDDCYDGSDELNCNGTCSNGGFRCVAPDARDRVLRSKCTWPRGKCDGFADCTDKSDEENCPCTAATFRCADGYDKANGDRCVSLAQRCNREQDCTDGSDEMNCVYSCDAADNFMCVTSTIARHPFAGYCINAHEVCDGYQDCNDASDEHDCHMRCPPGKWRCSSGLDVLGRTPCIPRADLCDRVSDCADLSDEAGCQYNCPTGTLPCLTKRIARWPQDTFCYLEQERCNGVEECEDGSDEFDCDDVTCTEEQFQCHGEHKCIPEFFLCNQYIDCADGSDEAGECAYNCDQVDAFMCTSGSLNGGFCLPSSHHCNGIIECMDGTDEADCDLTCDPDFFKCVNGSNRYYDSGNNGGRKSQCIPDNYKCDRDEDCTDGSDEHNCTYRCLADNQRACTTGMVKRWPYSGFCIYEQEWCDGFQDCHDASDEANCTHSCPSDGDHFRCKNNSDIFFGNGCLPLHLKCNRKQECQDGSDEEGCEYQCAGGEFKCQTKHTRNGTGYCIPASKRCDEVQDCEDSSDEQGCDVNCEEDEFKCIDVSNGDTCISKEYECDRVSDCVDGSDEHDNCTFACPEEYMFQCGTSTGTGTRDYCIPQHFKCDHVLHCDDGSDESLETCDHKCLKDREFKCYNGTDRFSNNNCIPLSYRCDRVQDCTDNSDEIRCSYNACTVSEFSCETGIIGGWPYEGYCIRRSKRCDGYRDCSDGSDEENCYNTCGPGGFQCKDGVDKEALDGCIPVSYLCDKTNDCSDGSDEGAQCNYTCPVGSRSCESGSLLIEGRGYCVLDYYWCNGEPDCVDRSDETNCTCESDEFQCNQRLGKHHACIPKRWQCDGEEDCTDGLDEDGCEYNCPPGQIACETGILARWPYVGFCYSREERCDGYIDCADRSDELRCNSTACPDDTFQCKTSRTNSTRECIAATKYCDRVQDCLDNSDELESECCYECAPDEFKCETLALAAPYSRGYCVNATLHRCDGHQHCEDGSDEKDCDGTCSTDHFFQCKAGYPIESTPNGCINVVKRCDGEVDCSDASDELDCSEPTVECPTGKIRCLTGTMWYSGYIDQNYCFSETDKCDGFTDCMDHSDEADCDYSCKDNEFQCGFPNATWGTVCIPGGKRCDGIRNCMNNADELGCSFPCDVHEFPCLSDGICLPLPNRCDQIIQCTDESDEMNCDKNRT